MKRIQNTTHAIALLTLAACGSTEAPPAIETATDAGAPSAETASREITAELMRGYIRELADDKYEGRGPGSRGDRAARQYLVGELEKLGLEPGAADGGWEQPFELVGVTAEQPAEWRFASEDESLVLQQWDDFIVSSGVQDETAAVADAELVFVGYGIQAPEYDWDDFDGADLNGKILVILNNDRSEFGVRFLYKFEL